jgi:hypothetical protein
LFLIRDPTGTADLSPIMRIAVLGGIAALMTAAPNA